MAEKSLRDIFGTTYPAGGCRADLDEVLPHRMLVVHGVERDHALDVGRREIEQRGDLRHPFVANPASLTLYDPERGKQCRHFLRVTRNQLVQLTSGFAP